MADWKLDIFAACAAVDRRDGDWFAVQSEDARNALALPPFLRWVSTVADGPNSPRLLRALNARVNRDAWEIADHPELVFRLAASCGSGRPQRHGYLKPPPARRAATLARRLLAEAYPTASDSEIDLLLSRHTRRSFAAFLDSIGCQDSKDALNSYDRLSRKDPQASTGVAKAAEAAPRRAKRTARR